MVAIEIGDVVEALEGRIPKEARRVLHGLAAEWSDVADCRALEVSQLKGAMTNEVYQINWPTTAGGKGATGRNVLVRIYGEGVEVFFDREDEVHTFECLSRHGQGPRLLGRFSNGRVEEFIHARTLSAADLRDPEISALIASKLREFHDLDMPGAKNVLLWDRLRNWLNAAKGLCPSEEAKEFSLDVMEEEIAALENNLSVEDQRIGFCHNDLQYGNIMIDEETRLVTIIDYEYASFNPIAYDLANHFCEMAADYHAEKPHILDFNKYPDFEERKRFLQIYLSSSGEKPDSVEIEDLLRRIEKYSLASHLSWGLWGIISVKSISFCCHVSCLFGPVFFRFIKGEVTIGPPGGTTCQRKQTTTTGARQGDQHSIRRPKRRHMLPLLLVLGFGLTSFVQLDLFHLQGHVNDIDFNYMEYARQRFQQYWSKKTVILHPKCP